MNGFLVAVIFAVVLLGFVYWRRAKVWTVVFDGMELTEQASDQYSLLKDNGIRCRMRNAPLRSNHNADIVNNTSSEPFEVRIIIEIHKDDIQKAKQILQQHVSGQYEFSFK
ncbi:hypothetical protein [Paenibacillus alkalitolerans]|uniref:hypothetical protein n=1 Tax=Paenibacillus alkalitolerans TaxID=2799335 RepID=UPI0018F692E8|nr:hypothetical protein [Paenibacillus alkalitolerans]